MILRLLIILFLSSVSLTTIVHNSFGKETSTNKKKKKKKKSKNKKKRKSKKTKKGKKKKKSKKSKKEKNDNLKIDIEEKEDKYYKKMLKNLTIEDLKALVERYNKDELRGITQAESPDSKSMNFDREIPSYNQKNNRKEIEKFEEAATETNKKEYPTSPLKNSKKIYELQKELNTLGKKLDTSGLSDEEIRLLKSIKRQTDMIVDHYETTGSFSQSYYNELIKLMNELAAILRHMNNKKDNVKVSDYYENVDSINSIIKNLENAYNTKGMLPKEELESVIASLKNNTDNLKNISNLGINKVVFKGLVFKIQIGAFRKRDFSKVLSKDITHEEGGLEQEDFEGMHQYTLGAFRNYWKAMEFKKQLIDTFLKKEPTSPLIVPYIDGKRVSMNNQKVLTHIRSTNLTKNNR